MSLETIFAERIDTKLILIRASELPKNSKVLIIEDVITTGKSSLECSNLVEKAKAEQQTYEYKPKTSGELVIDDTNECEWCQ